MQHESNVTLPRTAADALALWDAGQPVPAFRVESEGAAQSAIWAVAFEVISRIGSNKPPVVNVGISTREALIALEIVKSLTSKTVNPYARMVQIQLTGGGEPIFVQKPAPAAIVDGANPGSGHL